MKTRALLDKMKTAVDFEERPGKRLPLVEIFGSCRVLIENHCGVMFYEADKICVKSSQGCIFVHGSGLYIKRMTNELITVCGRISTVELRSRMS